MPEVRKERTGWRDEGLSNRHRRWGWDCPAVDIDFLMIEYDNGKAQAIVEYKNEHAKTQYSSHPSYKAMIDLGNRANLPVIACRYTDDYSKWKAVPLDSSAKIFLPNSKVMTEREWVSFLYKIRGKELPEGILDDNNVEI